MTQSSYPKANKWLEYLFHTDAVFYAAVVQYATKIGGSVDEVLSFFDEPEVVSKLNVIVEMKRRYEGVVLDLAYMLPYADYKDDSVLKKIVDKVIRYEKEMIDLINSVFYQSSPTTVRKEE